MKRCKEPFTVWRDGAPVTYTAGMILDDKDRILKTHSALFEDVAVTPRTARTVEAATSDPGEPRSLTPPQTTDLPPVPFDPGEHNAPDVLTYLEGADADEVRRVLEAEQAGQARKGVLDKGAKLVEG